jgi:Raf kinase inhibitor-like YbhB/YbcL family protein
MKINLGTLRASSPAFEHGGRIPTRHTVGGDAVPPPLRWSDAPAATASFAVVCHDPDAPLTHGFTHWVVYGIPAEENGLDGDGAQWTTGVTSAGTPDYQPPSPPPGHGDHFYYFHVYAVGELPAPLPAGLTADELIDAIDDHVLEQARVVGTWSRPAA